MILCDLKFRVFIEEERRDSDLDVVKRGNKDIYFIFKFCGLIV